MQELSKAKISLISLLSLKKYRDEHSLFVVEGPKIVDELLNSKFKIKCLVYNSDKCTDFNEGNVEVYITNEKGMKKISSFKTAPQVLAVAEIPLFETVVADFKDKLTMAVDEIQDPGNLGTLIRICDWFGIENLVCSENSADLYNPKVLQASMGAFLRVKVHYLNLVWFLDEYSKKTGHSCFGTFLEGENVYKTELPEVGLFVLGNEGRGISNDIKSKLKNKLFIPPYSSSGERAESLNIASAASIICSEFRRKHM